MPLNSRAKGKAGELEVAQYLRDRGFDAHRGQQFHGGGDSPDVACPDLAGIHLEVKRVERGSLYDWMGQACRDAAGKVPLVVHRRSRRPWVVVMKFDDFLMMYQKVNPHA